MIKTIKVLVLVSSLGFLSACTTKLQAPPPQISHAPAIDLPYQDVVKNVPDHIGTNVRWGGQVIAAETQNGTATLTVLAYPLNEDGKPTKKNNGNFSGGRFLVEAYGMDISEGTRFVTVYGTVTDQHVVTNGKFSKTIPVVTAIDTVHWEERDKYYTDHRGRYLPYHGLSVGLGYGRGRWGYSSLGYDYFGPFGRLHLNLYDVFRSSHYYGKGKYKSRNRRSHR